MQQHQLTRLQGRAPWTVRSRENFSFRMLYQSRGTLAIYVQAL